MNPKIPAADLTHLPPKALLSFLALSVSLAAGIFASTLQNLTAASVKVSVAATNASISVEPVTLQAESAALGLSATPATFAKTIVADSARLSLTASDPTLSAETVLQAQAASLNLGAANPDLARLLLTDSTYLTLGATNPVPQLAISVDSARLGLEVTSAAIAPLPAILQGQSVRIGLEATAPILRVPTLIQARSVRLDLGATSPAIARSVPAESARLGTLSTDASVQIGSPAINLGAESARLRLLAANPIISAALGPLTLNYVSRVQTAGGTVSPSAAALLDQVLYGTYSDGASGTGRVADFASNFGLLWLPFSSGLTGFNVNVINTTNNTNNGYLAADYRLQNGLQCSNAKFLNTNFSTALLPNINNCGLGYVARDTWKTTAAVSAIAIGQAGTNGFDLGSNQTTDSHRFRIYTSASQNRTSGTATCFQAYRAASTGYTSYMDNLSSFASIANNNPGNRNVYIGARNNASNVDELHFTNILQGAWIATAALTGSQANIMNNAMQHMRANRAALAP